MKRNLCLGLQFVLELPKVNNIKKEDLTPKQLGNVIKVLVLKKDIHATTMIKLALFRGIRIVQSSD